MHVLGLSGGGGSTVTCINGRTRTGSLNSQTADRYADRFRTGRGEGGREGEEDDGGEGVEESFPTFSEPQT